MDQTIFEYDILLWSRSGVNRIISGKGKGSGYSCFSWSGSRSWASLTKFVKKLPYKVLKNTKKIAKKLKTMELVHRCQFNSFLKLKVHFLITITNLCYFLAFFSSFFLKIYPPGSGSTALLFSVQWKQKIIIISINLINYLFIFYFCLDLDSEQIIQDPGKRSGSGFTTLV